MQHKNTGSSVMASELQELDVEWLWNGRIQKYALNIIEGPGGAGKTTLLASLTAGWSRGKGGIPDFRSEPPLNVMWISREADAERELVPAFNRAGADLSRVSIISSPLALDGIDIGWLDRELIKRQPAVVIVDPFASVVQGDPNRMSVARKVTDRLAGLAENEGVTIVLTRHLNKARGGGHVEAAGLYSGEWGFAARSVLLAAFNPDDTDDKAIAHTKCNNGPKKPTIGYMVVSGDDGKSKKIEWVGETDLTAERMLGLPTQLKGEEDVRPPKIADAETWLTKVLASGPIKSVEIYQKGLQAGFSKTTLERAKRKMKGLEAKLVGEVASGNQAWYWELDDGFPDEIREKRG